LKNFDHTIKLHNNKFRSEINGLRALAVLLVLLYHLEVSLFKAGFLGVDVFFVISGYLISKNILNDLQVNQFSFKHFYTKRFKRLFPALFFTLTSSLLAGFLLLAPSNLERLAKSALSGLFTVANLFFLSEEGYFDVESEFKPLLHVWSLSLEEQFYFVWPLLLFAAFKLIKNRLFFVLLLLAVISVFGSSIYNSIFPQAVFYLLPFRMFEFILGVLVIWLEKYKPPKGILVELLFLTSLVLIIYSSVCFNDVILMPGLFSLIPCIGTMLVIWVGQYVHNSAIVLKNKVFDIIGKTSYSVYLIHWPLIVYYKYYTLSDLTIINKIAIAITSIVLGYLMWRYIENIFRYKILKINKIDYIWYAMPVSIALLSVFAISIWTTKGYPSRYPSALYLSVDEMRKERKNYWADAKKANVICGTNEKKVIVMGNSHATDLIYALKNNGFEAEIVFLPTSHMCYNFGTAINKVNTKKCNSKKIKNLENENWSTADAIYLHDHWVKKDLQNLEEILMEIRTLTKAPIYVFGPKMIFSKSVSDIIYACRSSSSKAINKSAQKFAELNRETLNDSLIYFFKEKHYKNDNIFYVDILAHQSSLNNQYNVVSPQNLDFLYFDGAHFTEAGSTELGKQLIKSYPEVFNL